MKASSFGWMAIDPKTLRRMRRELEAEQTGVVDEMGVGHLHTAYADRFFPGTSTLQTRARYVFFVAWNYLTLANANVSRDRLAARKSRLELQVTGRLIEEHGKGRGNGIIGVMNYPEPTVQAPDFSYWTALREWELYDGAALSSLTKRWQPRRVTRRGAHLGKPRELAEDPLAEFDVPPPPDGWPNEMSKLSLGLTAAEAEWLLDKWEHMKTPSILSAAAPLLREGSAPKADLLWQDTVVTEAASRLDGVEAARHRLPSFSAGLMHARDASLLAELVRATYAAFVERDHERDQVGGSGAGEKYRSALDLYFGSRAKDLTRALALNLDDVRRDASELGRSQLGLMDLLSDTQAAWRRASSGKTLLDNTGLRKKFEEVELRRKGGSRARLPLIPGRDKRRQFMRDAPAVHAIDYRWPVVRRIMTDILNGLHRP